MAGPDGTCEQGKSARREEEHVMIARHWRALAHPHEAAAYVEHLQTDTFPQLSKMAGFIDASVLRRDEHRGVEFVVITHWESLDAIVGFAGKDPELAVVPERVRSMMIEFDRRARHYEVVERSESRN
jgi:heme-degrading monooxygenase HmoA